MKNPKIVKLVLLAKLDNDNIHQVIISQDHKDALLSLILQLKFSGHDSILIGKTRIEGIDF